MSYLLVFAISFSLSYLAGAFLSGKLTLPSQTPQNSNRGMGCSKKKRKDVR
jgi:hypothetical protein